MKIIITGSSGFLGTYLSSYLEGQGHSLIKLTSQNCDLTITDSLKSYSNEKYDMIFHLAAWTQAGDFCIKYPGDQWIINQQINTNVLRWWARDQQQAKLIFIGTSCVYSPDSELRETDYMCGEPIDSLYTYAMTKRMLYQGARALSRQYNLCYLCAIPSTLYGSGYHTDGRQMHFIFDLIR
jgi:GDP-L-fucose synthase